MKKAVIFLIIATVVLSGLYWLNRPQTDAELVLYGNVDIRQVNSAFRVGGRLQKMNFEEGDTVKKGEIIAELDADPLKNTLNQAEAKVRQAQAALKNAEQINNRKQALCRSKNASQQDCDTARANYDIAKADLEYALASYDVAETAYNDAFLKAPSDGIILIRIVEPGTLLSAGVPVYTISLNNKMWARAYIKETELGKVKIGSKVHITTDSTDKIYHGHVGFISSTAEFTPKSIETASLRTDLVYRLRIIIDDADDFLKQGMPITIHLAE
jgi:HlyD family secretion protein